MPKNKTPRSVSQVNSTSSSTFPADNVPVWIYVMFRKNPSSGHDKVTTKVSEDGPVFWNRHVIYVFCCSCHFDRHEGEIMNLLADRAKRIERVCLVDRPVDYSFLPDGLFSYMAKTLPNLQFVYLRELDLEKVNRGTVEKLSQHTHLKKLIVHGCRNYEVFQDFHGLPQLLVVKGEIVGLKQMLGDFNDLDQSNQTSTRGSLSSTAQSQKSSTYCNNSSLSTDNQKLRIVNSASPIAVSHQ